jgi:hypothetical protein
MSTARAADISAAAIQSQIMTGPYRKSLARASEGGATKRRRNRRRALRVVRPRYGGDWP